MGIIITKWIHCTETKPDRVKGIAGSGKSITISAYDDNHAFQDSHEAACREVIKRVFKENPDDYIIIQQAHDKVDGFIWCVVHVTEAWIRKLKEAVE